MKRFLSLLVVIVFSVLMLAGCGSAATTQTATGETYEIIFNTADVETTATAQIALAWQKIIEEKSNGRIKFINYFSGTMATSPELIDATKNGVIDMCFFVTSLYPGIIVGSNILSAPGLGLTFDENGAMATWETINGNEQLKNEFKGMKLLATCTNGGFTIINSKKPIEKLSDFKGLRIRINNAMTQGFITYLDGTPMSFNVPDTYENIEKRVCDGSWMDWDWFFQNRLYEVAPYAVDTEGLCSTTTAFVMNEDCYNKLPADLKAIIDENSGEPFVRLAGRIKKEGNDKAWAAYKEAGTLTSLSAEILAEVPAATKAGLDRFIADANKAGLDGQAIVDYAKATVEKWCKK
jgi:TRAP-type C4-dicarboxylate transport system substrate-binding protein